ncbi:hypothetical protein OQA88_8224 [Cercophora sp. LCS_1]
MRGLQRLRGSASAFSTCSAPAIRTTPAASLVKSELATLTHLCSRRTQAWTGLRIQRRCLSATSSRFEKGTVLPVAEESRGVTEAEAEEEAEIEEYENGRYEVETDLIAPPPRSVAPIPEQITDPNYVPAESGAGLEEVGGFEDWWDRPGHWGESKKYVGFGPQEKVTDRALLEVLTRRAVVEALVLKRYSENRIEPSAALTVTRGEEELLNVVKAQIVAGPDGTAALQEGDYERIWGSLKEAREEEDAYGSAAPEISAEAAKELVKSWDSEWKSVQVKDPVVKFYVAKRIQRLTGHIVTDSTLMTLSTVRHLINHLAQPPKAKKLVEEIEANGILKDLPNVQVFSRRVTPVDKEKMVGRWKIIERELQKRGLPVLGTGGYKKAVEKRWIQGGV